MDPNSKKEALNGLKVKVTAYKGLIVIEPIEPEKDASAKKGWVPVGPGRFGSVLCKTKGHLGVSKEAVNLLRQVQRGVDSIGDLSWWECDDGSHAFSWFGAAYRIIDPSTAIGDRDYTVLPSLLQDCETIPNEVPDEAKAAIDGAKGEPIYRWKDQRGIDLEDGATMSNP